MRKTEELRHQSTLEEQLLHLRVTEPLGFDKKIVESPTKATKLNNKLI